MRFFRRRRADTDAESSIDHLASEGPGYWERILEPDQRDNLVRCVLDDLRGRGLEPRVVGPAVVVDRGGAPLTLGLDNLAQLCVQEPVERWPAMVQAHFDSLTLDAAPDRMTYDGARERLRVRLYGADMEMGMSLRRPVCASVTEVLVIDSPASVRAVSPSDAAGWGVEEAELWDEGERRTWAEPAPEREEAGPGGDVSIFFGEGFYTASHLLRLEALMGPLPPAGALVAVPTRHLFAVHALRSAAALNGAAGALAGLADDWFQRGPGSITPGLLWWRIGGFVDVPMERQAGRIEIVPPAELTAVLNTLR